MDQEPTRMNLLHVNPLENINILIQFSPHQQNPQESGPGRFCSMPKTASKDILERNKNICQVCNIVYDTEADTELDSLWLKCSKIHCSYWAHAKCHGI